MKSEYIIQAIGLALINIPLHAQEAEISEAEEILNLQTIEISIMTGGSFLGVKNDMETAMLNSGLDDKSYGFFGSSTDHPYSTIAPAINIECRYYLDTTYGIGLQLALPSTITTNGYEQIGIGNHLSLKSKMFAITPTFVYRSKNNRNIFNIGPDIARFAIKQEDRGAYPVAQKSWNIGLYSNASFTLSKKPRKLVFLSISYRLHGNTIVGPFTEEHMTGVLTPDPATHTSVFQETQVNPSNLNVGLGLRF